MKNNILAALLNCALSIAGSAQSYTYFDSLFYNVETDVYVAHNLLTENANGYVVGGLRGHNAQQNLVMMTFNLDGSEPIIQYPQSPSGNYSGWYGPQYISTSDGGFLWAGLTSFTKSEIIKYSNLTDTTWTYRALIPDSVMWLFQPLEIADGYLVCGLQALYSSNPLMPYTTDLLVMKLNLDGQLIWKKTHVIHQPLTEPYDFRFLRFSGIFTLDNGDIILSGARYGPTQPFIARLDNEGENLQMYEFGSLEFHDWMPWLVPLENHQFMVGYGYTDSLLMNTYKAGNSHLMLFDVDQMLPLWDNEDDNVTWYGQFIMDMIQTNDGGYATCGFHLVPPFQYEGFIQKWSSSGIVEWTKYYNHLPANDNHFSEFYEITSTQDGGYLLCGSYRFGNLPARGWVLKVDDCGDIEDLGCPVSVQEATTEKQGLIVWPVPASERLNVQTVLPGGQWLLCITDIFGHLVKTEQRTNLHNAQSIAIQNLPAGVYLLTASDEKGHRWTKKFVVEAE